MAGAKVGDIGTQVQRAVAQQAQYVTILIGANDVCTSSSAAMTTTATFQSEFQRAMNALQAGLPPGAHIFVSSIPNIYRLWSVLHSNPIAELVWYGAGICQSMLSPFNTPADRQQVLAQVVADNGALAQVCDHTPGCKWDGDATFNYSFQASQISHLDYFHPNLSGQAVLAAETWAAVVVAGDSLTAQRRGDHCQRRTAIKPPAAPHRASTPTSLHTESPGNPL